MTTKKRTKKTVKKAVKKAVKKSVKKTSSKNRIKVTATPAAKKGTEAQGTATPPNSVSDNSQHVFPIRSVVAKMVQLGLLTPSEAGAQSEQMNSWDFETINLVSNFLTNPAISGKFSKEVAGKFGLVWDPPAQRFGGFFRRSPILITKKEAMRLERPDPKAEDKSLSQLTPRLDRAVKAHEQFSSQLTSRLEQLATGGIKAESDSKWFESFDSKPISETSSKNVTTHQHLEKLEADYAEKMRMFLKSKRELGEAKRLLEREYKLAEEKESEHPTASVADKASEQKKDEINSDVLFNAVI